MSQILIPVLWVLGGVVLVVIAVVVALVVVTVMGRRPATTTGTPSVVAIYKRPHVLGATACILLFSFVAVMSGLVPATWADIWQHPGPGQIGTWAWRNVLWVAFEAGLLVVIIWLLCAQHRPLAKTLSGVVGLVALALFVVCPFLSALHWEFTNWLAAHNAPQTLIAVECARNDPAKIGHCELADGQRTAILPVRAFGQNEVRHCFDFTNPATQWRREGDVLHFEMPRGAGGTDIAYQPKPYNESCRRLI